MELKAFIFDLDGLLIDSEPLWSQAEMELFHDLEIPPQDPIISQTKGLRTDEIVRHWYAHFPWKGWSQSEVADRLSRRVCELVATMGEPLPGAVEAVYLCQKMGIPLALATSSSMPLVHAALHRLDLQEVFSVMASAETESFGKPHPAVYLSAASRLGMPPWQCIAFEDSVRGIISAKSAGMQCIAVPAAEERDDPEFAAADTILDSLEQVRPEWVEALMQQSSA